MNGSRLFVYNTLSRKNEEFIPLDGNKVRMFVCGQTVYDDAHLGHAKSYIDFDIIARWLRFLGYKLTYVQNITDVDDKIIARAKERGEDPISLARSYEKRLLEDMERLDVKGSIDMYPRSHDYMDSIKKQIQLLLDKGYAYIVGSDVYYDVSKFKDYTKISGMRIEELEKHRIDVNKDKRNPYDFALWKGAKPGEPSWEITLARGGEEMTLAGRPGWHIEDTAMTYAIFGEQYDVHGGAIELLFPHHTNEIAQAEAAFGKVPFVKYWLHSGILSIKGEKMSKSLKNFVTIRESLIKHSGEAIRLFVASTHYRKEISYSERLLYDAERKLNYFYSSLTLFYNVLQSEGSTADAELSKISGILESEFISAMNDDFNTPLAISSLTTAMAGLRKLADSGEPVGKEAKDGIINTVLRLAGVIGILTDGSYKKTIPEGAVKLLVEREELRRAGKYSESDGIRERLGREYKLGIEDTEHGTIWWNIRG